MANTREPRYDPVPGSEANNNNNEAAAAAPPPPAPAAAPGSTNNNQPATKPAATKPAATNNNAPSPLEAFWVLVSLIIGIGLFVKARFLYTMPDNGVDITFTSMVAIGYIIFFYVILALSAVCLFVCSVDATRSTSASPKVLAAVGLPFAVFAICYNGWTWELFYVAVLSVVVGSAALGGMLHFILGGCSVSSEDSMV